MTCLPTETIDEVKQTLRLLVKFGRNSKYCPYPTTRLFPYIPLPGTELFNIAQKHGFIAPSTLDGWTELDYQQFEERCEKIRPWLSSDAAAYIAKAIQKVSYMSEFFIGQGADEAKLDSLLNDLESYAE